MKKSIIVICIVAVIAIIVAIVIYSLNNVCLAFSNEIDADVTISFFTIISAIFVPTVAIITAMLYYGALIEQRKQNENLILQQFDAQFNELLMHHSQIREETCIFHPYPQNNNFISKRYDGIEAFKRIWLTYRLLVKAIISRIDYTIDWESQLHEYDSANENVDPDGILLNTDPKALDNQIELINQKFRVSAIGYIFKIDGKQTYENVEHEAFSLIYKKFFCSSALYFTQLCSVLKFLERNFKTYNISKELQNEYIQRLKDNLSQVEVCVIQCYANFDLSNKEMINNFILTPTQI